MKSTISGKPLLTVFLVLALGCAGGWEVPSPSGIASGRLTITGTACKQGQPVMEGIAILVPCGYHVSRFDSNGPLPLPITGTVTAGEYFFMDVDTGYHNLIIQESQGWAVFAESLHVRPDSKSIKTCSLRAPGAVRGVLYDSLGRVPESTFVYLRGTPYSTLTDSIGVFRFEHLPVGNFIVGLELDSIRTRMFPIKAAPADYDIVAALPENSTGVFIRNNNTFNLTEGETLYTVIILEEQ